MGLTTRTEADFDRLSWHDNHIYGFYFSVGDIAREDWRSDLLLDIDHIVEWVCGVDRQPRFRVAPATLIFHDVTDLRIQTDWGDSGHQVALHEIAIDRIERQPVTNQKICLDRAYYRWFIALNLPRDGQIFFGASGFSQTLRAEPVLIAQQKLSPAQRPNLFAAKSG